MEYKKESKLIEIFKKIKLEADPRMAENVYHTIILRNKRETLFKLWAFAFAGFISFVGLIPMTITLLGNLARSGLYDYFSLIFENGWSMLSYWKELLFSMAQSLPTTSIVFTLSLIFVFFLSIRYTMKEIDKNQLMGFVKLSV